ncbi:hypothetical protein DL93DRAFT_2167342 [Clavulina sp. PMI_390]|nr:hypothetical protein DL93DRAFT_2167342 [Clavulina sp. PMI_390]
MSAPDPLFMAAHYAGPIQAGAYVNCLFTGIALMQLQVYVRKYKNDSILIRVLVALCCSAMTVDAALTCYQAYNSSIVQFGSIEATYTLSQPFQVALDLLDIPSTLVQLFFSWRVKRLTGRTWVFVFVAFTVIVQWAITITAASIGHVHVTILQALSITGHVLWSLSLAVDTLITINLVLFFNTRKTGFSDTDDFLGRLNRLTVQTGIVISWWNLAIIIITSTTSDFTDFAFIVSFPPLYVITLMSSLNARHATSHGNRWSDDTPWSNSGTATAPRRVTNVGHSNIQVTRTTEQVEAFHLDERHPGTEPASPRPASTHPYATSRAIADNGMTRSKISHLVSMPRDVSSGEMDAESESAKVDLELGGDDLSPNLRSNHHGGEVRQHGSYDGKPQSDVKAWAV